MYVVVNYITQLVNVLSSFLQPNDRSDNEIVKEYFLKDSTVRQAQVHARFRKVLLCINTAVHS